MRSITRSSQQVRQMKARAVVHTRFSLDWEPIDAFQSLVEALSVDPARVVAGQGVKGAGRVLRDVWDEARELDQEELAALEAETAPEPEPEPELNHRQATELVEKQHELDEIRARELKLRLGMAVDDDPHRGFPANWKTWQPWRRPGHRQEVVVKRFKRFGIKA